MQDLHRSTILIQQAQAATAIKSNTALQNIIPQAAEAGIWTAGEVLAFVTHLGIETDKKYTQEAAATECGQADLAQAELLAVTADAGEVSAQAAP